MASGEGTRRGVFADLVVGLAEDVGRTVGAEIGRAKAEATERARSTAKASAYVGGAAFLGLVSAGALASFPILALRRVVPPWAVAALVAGGAGAGAVALGRRGLEELQEAAPTRGR
jgi:hypothetical protein